MRALVSAGRIRIRAPFPFPPPSCLSLLFSFFHFHSFSLSLSLSLCRRKSVEEHASRLAARLYGKRIFFGQTGETRKNVHESLSLSLSLSLSAVRDSCSLLRNFAFGLARGSFASRIRAYSRGR